MAGREHRGPRRGDVRHGLTVVDDDNFAAAATFMHHCGGGRVLGHRRSRGRCVLQVGHARIHQQQYQRHHERRHRSRSASSDGTHDGRVLYAAAAWSHVMAASWLAPRTAQRKETYEKSNRRTIITTTDTTTITKLRRFLNLVCLFESPEGYNTKT